MTAGALLRTTRRRHGLTQRQLAIRARTSQAAISRIERDLVSPAVATLAELLRLMNEELVLEAREVDGGHDVTLIRRNLERPIEAGSAAALRDPGSSRRSSASACASLRSITSSP
jgi:transcriptional regulator with XRE-family HTH domain